jgi:prepilin-type N-terminal cleavage/methylation domain-containing protein
MIARVRGRLAESGGYTLSEMIVVLTILLIVVAGLGQLFESASKAEVDMSNRFRAQQNARLALDGLRREIHCANAVTMGTLPTSSITITLGKYCPSNTTGATASFTWCTVGAAAPYTLWRYTGTSCSGAGKPWVSNLTTPSGDLTTPPRVFTGYTAPVNGSLGTLSVDLPVDLTPSDAKQRYDVKDDIVLRNTIRP